MRSCSGRPRLRKPLAMLTTSARLLLIMSARACFALAMVRRSSATFMSSASAHSSMLTMVWGSISGASPSCSLAPSAALVSASAERTASRSTRLRICSASEISCSCVSSFCGLPFLSLLMWLRSHDTESLGSITCRMPERTFGAGTAASSPRDCTPDDRMSARGPLRERPRGRPAVAMDNAVCACTPRADGFSKYKALHDATIKAAMAAIRKRRPMLLAASAPAAFRAPGPLTAGAPGSSSARR
mmetsp:Transcript_14804/g.44612  ORF Transcript_14804/g.44612 Transcript_14804/m.44612 type:complete len:244 (-) Transcript_14804:149-880(-)